VLERRPKDSATRWLSEVKAQVRPRPQLQLQPDRCALLLIDLQRAFTSPTERTFLPAAAALLPRVKRLLAAWRARGGMVVVTQHGHRSARSAGMMGRFYASVIVRGSPAAALAEEVLPKAGELLVHKHTYDAFHHTRLERALRARGIEQVLIAGVLTHLCCETTARSAFVRGFEVYVVADGTATRSERLQLGSLLAVADGFGRVVDTKEVLGACARRS
jgi:bifunctional isochorismate lyase / aryl carrier protein